MLQRKSNKLKKPQTYPHTCLSIFSSSVRGLSLDLLLDLLIRVFDFPS